MKVWQWKKGGNAPGCFPRKNPTENCGKTSFTDSSLSTFRRWRKSTNDITILADRPTILEHRLLGNVNVRRTDCKNEKKDLYSLEIKTKTKKKYNLSRHEKYESLDLLSIIKGKFVKRNVKILSISFCCYPTKPTWKIYFMRGQRRTFYQDMLIYLEDIYTIPSGYIP